MSDQIPECKKAFDCRECDKNCECKDWNDYREKKKAEALKMAEEMPIIVEYFDFCGLRYGSIEDWQKKLAKMSFGC